MFGLSSVWDIIQQLGANAVAKLMGELTKIVLLGQGALDKAKPIVANLIQELKDHSISSTQAVFQAISDLASIIAGNQDARNVFVPRGIFDFIINMFGLSSVWDIIQQLGANAVAKLM